MTEVKVGHTRHQRRPGSPSHSGTRHNAPAGGLRLVTVTGTVIVTPMAVTVCQCRPAVAAWERLKVRAPSHESELTEDCRPRAGSITMTRRLVWPRTTVGPG